VTNRVSVSPAIPTAAVAGVVFKPPRFSTLHNAHQPQQAVLLLLLRPRNLRHAFGELRAPKPAHFGNPRVDRVEVLALALEFSVL
jgi:hypothetical protein|tara:strand:+ start:224 stop:478 length:255 start_codon:yes stop_codon:yes gene_type:complete